MSRHIFSGALVLTVGLSFPALAEPSADKAAELRAAIAACDKGASVPLDPDATQPAVHFGEFILKTANLDKASIDEMKTLAAECKLAMAGAPEQKRLKLEWLRVAYFVGFVDFEQSVDAVAAEKRGYAEEVRRIAATGSAEANYLLFELYSGSSEPGDAESSVGVTRQEALQGLAAAAAAGHLEALNALLYQYRHGPNLRRDPQAAVRTAELIMDLPRQGPGSAGDFEARQRELARFTFAAILATNDGFPPEKQARGFAVLKELMDRKYPGSGVPYAAALGYGRGTKQDAAAARAVLEAALAANDETALGPLADMLANGEGGAVDGKRALDLLRNAKPEQLDAAARMVLAGLYLDNRFTGRRPREAIRVLAAADDDIDALVRAAGLLADYQEPVAGKDRFAKRLTAAVLIGEPGAAMALARLKLSGNADFQDPDGARTLLAKLSADGDPEAAVLYAEAQYENLTSASFRPSRRDGGVTDAEIEALIHDLTARKQASAFRLKAELMRAGVVFPQDDEAATRALISAAELGDVTAMVLLGEAYDEGLGTPKDPRERLRWWREAARRGSLDARERIAGAFTFDFFDRLISLREGISERIALYNNGGGAGLMGGAMAAMDIAGAFSGSRAGAAGTAALAVAVMDGFRLAPAGLVDDKLVPLAHALPDEVRAAIETILKQDGFFAGEPNGTFGPDVRKALAAWVDTKGPLPDIVDAPAVAAAAAPADGLPAELVDRLRSRALTAANSAKSVHERSDAMALIGTLARSGDIAARWALVSNYDNASFVRDKVSPQEVTRYGLDVLVTKPKGAEKIETDFIFTLTAMAEEGRSAAFGGALIDAVRDDPRLQDPLTLGSVMQELVFAPGACDAIVAAAKKAVIPDFGVDGCAEAAGAALIAFAKAKGPAGVEAAARQAAAVELRGLDTATVR